MVQFIIPFQVAPVSLAEAISVIEKFVKEVHANESGTILYKSFQEIEHKTCFTHVMTFKDERAHEIHRASPYLKIFVDALYPLCTVKPKNISVNEILV